MSGEHIEIAILCGAGCEGKHQLELTSGAKFKEDIVLSKDVSEIFYALNCKNEDFKINNGAIIDARSSNILYQTLKEHEENSAELSEENQKIFDSYEKYRNGDKDNKEKVKLDFKNLYRCFLNNEENDSRIGGISVSSKEKEFFYKNISLCAYADELFNYLRFPKLYKTENGKVLKLYYSAFLSMLKSLYKTTNPDEKKEFDIKSYLPEEFDVIGNREKLLKEIEKWQDEIIKKYSDNTDSSESKKLYYCTMKKLVERYKKTAEVTAEIITTNYTNFAEKLTGFKTYYLHGRLDKFENIKTKEVLNLNEFEDEKDVIFPFIFIPSGVKPIVCDWQIEQYANAIRLFNEADIFIILGYAINPDDEHIKNFIRERLNKRKKIYLFVYHKNEEKSYDEDDDNKEFKNSRYLEIIHFTDKEKPAVLKSFEDNFEEILNSSL